MHARALSTIRTRFRSFLQDTRGTLSVEATLIFPVLAFVYVASFVWFDAFRVQNINLKATYTVSDMISREYEKIDRSYLDGLDQIYDYLTYADHPTQLRVTTIECTKDCDDDSTRNLEVCWSRASTGRGVLGTGDLAHYEDHIPLFAFGDTLIMTETFMEYTPPFRVGINAQEFENAVFTRPRLTGQVKFEDSGILHDCNNN